MLALPALAIEHGDFVFSSSIKNAAGATLITPADTFCLEKGYGYDFLACPQRDAQQPFFFSVQVPDGNYKVTVTYGSKKKAANTCLRA